jgi:Malectin domain/Domain of unknown function (DUF5122) beta-propeller
MPGRFRRPVVTLVAALSVALPVIAVDAPAGAFQIAQNQTVSAAPVPWTPQITDGKVEAIVQVGNRMIVGGTFTSAQNAGGGTTFSRNRILAFNATTGAIDTTFSPNVNGEITSMVVSPEGGAIIIAGTFTSVNGTTRNRLAKLDATTGALITNFNPNAGGKVNDIALWGNSLIAGGGFTSMGGSTRQRLAAVTTSTGALDNRVNNLSVAGVFNGGGTNIQKLDVSPDGSRLMIIGNFTSVAAQPRVQIAMVNLTTNPATLSSWSTDGFSGACSPSFNTYMRDVEFSPDGTYFVVGDTGAGYYPTTLCDTVTRWETGATGPGQQPTWIDYSGGDTITAVAATGSTVYAGGHMRWMNNEAVGDVAAGGAVSREGLTALDPQNGVPLQWNPTRARGVGVFAFLATPAGLWIGHDTKTVAHQTHNRIAFFPLAGGAPVVSAPDATLPGTLYTTTRTACPAPDTSVLYRIDAGGPELPSIDCGPAWSADEDAASPFRNEGSNAAGWGPIAGVTAAVPSGTPRAIFESERWSPSDNPPMQWSFPAQAGSHLQVRLYFSNSYDGTSQPGQRQFDVTLDGTLILNDYDIVADVGNRTGTMKSYNITSDGTVNIDFTHVVENPLINGIEIVDRDAPPMPEPQPLSDPFVLGRRNLDGATVGPDTTLTTPIDWSDAAGGFFLNGKVYAGWANGRLYSWTFNGSTFGGPVGGVDVLANGNYVFGPTWTSFADVTGMFWKGGRLYYTREGDHRLFYRYFSPTSEIVGSIQYIASGPNVDGLDWSGIEGMTQAGSKIFYASSDGDLVRIDMNGTVPVPGTSVAISGPSIDGRDWRSNAMFFRSG